MRQIEKNVSPMSNEGRNAYVIEHITDALLKLLRETPMEDISISELCELAGNGQRQALRERTSRLANSSIPCLLILKSIGIFMRC